MLDRFGRAVLAGNAALFVGSGLSKAASGKFPDWRELLDPMRSEAEIPKSLADLPLAAEYYEQVKGRRKLEDHIADAIGGIRASSSRGHELLAELPVSEVWTTNYDRLLEEAMPSASVVLNDRNLANRLEPGHKRLIKLHGSLATDASWEAPPVITRGDYERYEQTHPRMWAALTATFLTRSVLFIGFGFDDQNVELLLRLSRTLESPASEHFAVLRRPKCETDAKLFQHRVRDLERSGVSVVEVKEHGDLVPLLELLVRRCKPPHLFVSGSGDGIDKICRHLGSRLASVRGITLVSLAGDAGRGVSYGFAEKLRRQGLYDADRVRFLFRAKDEEAGIPPPAPDERTGVAVYTDWDVGRLRREAIDGARAMVVLGGANRTRAEARVADESGIPIVPMAASGGVAYEIWSTQREKLDDLTLGGGPVRPERFIALAERDGRRHLPAAVHLVRQAMYL